MATNITDENGMPPGGLMSWMKQLNPRRQELIRPVLENPREFVLLSVRAAAAKVRTDPATMVRIIQRMGFENYRSFQNYLRDLSIANATSLDGMQESARTLANIPDYLNATMEQDVRNLNSVRNKLDAKRLASAAKRIHGARRRLILGGDLAENLVHYFEHHLTLIGLPVLIATTVGRSLHITRSIGKGDVVIAISFRKGLRQTVEGMQRARKNGAYCIGITGTYVSPIARLADEFFVAPVESNSFIDSYVAPMSLANLILVACANYDRDTSLSLLREAAKEQRQGFRWFETE
ncbi:MurR/RpiR family transcriptional regulator [Granulicella sp. L60]|uniref:MurR/RpiR family transcriptional regulator n=1 Tax=Granulicella sp. L60 TaxID=1641866 RepID=UPI00131C714A|nr:MurR/RpiR family transcriptional regulator [Granulicella sp. L60]